MKIIFFGFDRNAKRFERVKVRAHGALAEVAAARLRDAEVAGAVDHRAEIHDDAPGHPRGILIHLFEGKARGRNDANRGSFPCYFDTDALEHFNQAIDLLDLRHIVENGRTFIEKHRAQKRDRAVFGSARGHGARKLVASLYSEINNRSRCGFLWHMSYHTARSAHCKSG